MSESKFYIMAVAKIKENRFEEAIELLTKAIEERPIADYYSERGVCYIHTEELDLSMFDLNKAVELEPDYSYRYACRAYLKGKMGDPRGAVEDYEKAVELDPSDAVAYNNLGLAQENLGYWEKAQANFQKSNEILGYDPEKRAKENLAVTKDDQIIETEPVVEEKEEPKPSKKRIVFDVFRKKSAFKEFAQFVKNGFKLKEDDQEGKS